MKQSRTHTCGELRLEHVGQSVTLVGWYENFRRVSKQLGFLVLRDFYGTVQVVIQSEKMMEQVLGINKESTLSVTGVVEERSSKNPDSPTGDIEIFPESLGVLGSCRCNELPFEIIRSKEADENTRLKYRYLDLRNPEMKNNILLRSNVISELRSRMQEEGFLEITTPILTASSPEGARDYLVPSRNYPGKFYALPQAPQQFKQLLMVSGFDRYFQIAPCFRDEDARADRSPGEFYQLDMEMAFASQEDVFSVIETVLPPVFEKYGVYKISSKAPFTRISYRDSMERFGSDKPDLRINLIVQDLTNTMIQSEFEPFHNRIVKAVVIHDFDESRKFIENTCKEIESFIENKVFWFKVNEEMNFVGGIAKYVLDKKTPLIEALGLKSGDFVCITAGTSKPEAQKNSGVIRNLLGNRVKQCMDNDKYEFCWIIDFPMYEFNEESGCLDFCHNPFSMPQGGMEALDIKNPLDIYAYQYDLVCNGVELSSGAIRNHDPDIMVKAFELAGLGIEDVKSRFPALYNAFCFGAPPHGGIAPGIDRMIMLLSGESSIREIIPFPMNSKAQDLMCEAPGTVSQEQLEAVHIRSIEM